MLAICIDNRADKTVVKADLISPALYTRKCTKVDSWRGNEPTEHSLAIVQIDVNHVHLKQEVIVNSETLQEDARIGEDIGLDLLWDNSDQKLMNNRLLAILGNRQEKIQKSFQVRANVLLFMLTQIV